MTRTSRYIPEPSSPGPCAQLSVHSACLSAQDCREQGRELSQILASAVQRLDRMEEQMDALTSKKSAWSIF